MKFQIIKNSEGCKKWDIPDNEYRGQIEGLCCGWEFEVRKPDGTLDSFSVIHEEADPEWTWDNNHYSEMCEWHGFEPTGRVVFRGYGKLYWHAEERDWCVQPLTDEEVDEILAERGGE